MKENTDNTAIQTQEELDQLLQEGRIGYLRYVLEGDNSDDFIDWCKNHGTEPSDESAEFFVEQTDISVMERQTINDEEYGIWL